MKNPKINPIHTSLIVILLLVSALETGCKTASKDSRLPENTALSDDQALIRYETKGSGDATLFFIHCWSCDRRYWDNQFDLFSKYFRVVRIDLAGHGESTSSRKNYTIQKFAHDVEAVIAKLKLDNVILIGHSMGGPVAVQTALDTPDAIAGIIAVDSFETAFKWPKTKNEITALTKPFKTDFRNTTARMVRSMFKPDANPQLVRQIANDMSTAPSAVANSALTELVYWMSDYPQFKQKLRVPLYHINAKPEQSVPSNNNQTIYIDHVGHFIPQAAPASFNGALEQTVAKILGL
ncbi:MAG TPA: alpha/beta hydrolase [Crenotrichaceae bacterium]|nr:alpha/beta hydrolase [Crenotrichaceae bacterium]